MSPERALKLARQVTSRRVLRSDPDHEDIAQEVALEILALAERRPDMPEGYLVGAGKRRLYDALKARTWTGMATNSGTPVDPLRRPHGSVDELLEAEASGAVAPDFLAPLVTEEPGYEEAEWRAMASEHIDIAIARLPSADQRAVAQGIRDGFGAPEVFPGVSRKTAHSTWRRARAQLRQELAWMTDDEGRVAA